MIDTAQLRALAGDSPELILEILCDFEREAVVTLGEISGCFAEGCFEDAQAKLHQLAGASGTLGLTMFYEKIRNLETLSEQKQEGGGEGQFQLQEVCDLLKASAREARRLFSV